MPADAGMEYRPLGPMGMDGGSEARIMRFRRREEEGKSLTASSVLSALESQRLHSLRESLEKGTKR